MSISTSKLDFKTQKFHKCQWGFVNFPALKWQIDFKLWYSKDLYNTLFNHKSLLANLEQSTQE